MIDIHSHLIYGVDDGASKIEDSIRMLEEANKVGIKEIISTVHVYGNLFTQEKLDEKLMNLKNKAKEFGLSIELGYEIYINSLQDVCAEEIKRLTMNGSEYILLEFPYSEFPKNAYEITNTLQLNGMIPIIAHPERCKLFIENQDVLMCFLEAGCLIQLDAASILGVYGRHAKHLSKILLKNNKVHFIASNAHFADDYSDWFSKAHTKVRRWVGEEYTDALFNKNAIAITNDKKAALEKAVQTGRCLYETTSGEYRKFG